MRTVLAPRRDLFAAGDPSAATAALALHYVALPTTIVESVRATLKSPRYGHPVHIEVATSHGPCRHCLRGFVIGRERRILFTHDPFDGIESLPLPGPVFIHAEPCMRYRESGGFPVDLRFHRLTLDAYARGRRLVDEVNVTNGEVDNALERLFAIPDTDYVHVRDMQAGCYDLRVERAATGCSPTALE